MIAGQFEQCKLGIPAIDDEHFSLLAELEALIELIRNGEPYEAAVDQIKSNLRLHFDHELEMMKRANFPYIAAHMRDHNNLLELVDKFAAQVRIGTSLAYTTMVVENMFADHITGVDSLYVDFLRTLDD